VSATAAVLARFVAVPAGVPVDPDAEEARQWLVDELSKPEYRAAEPTWFDRLAKAVVDWITSLTTGAGGGPPGIGALIVVLLVTVIVVVAFLLFGLPRLNRRSGVTGSLFGDDDQRDAAAIRAAAQLAASRGDYSLGVAEMFRAIARGLVERTVLNTMPGTTAHDFALRAAAAFPAAATALATAASAFDDVRYLGRDGTREQYEQVAALERELRASRASLEPVAR
jgi:hypothetical protein